VSNDNDCEPDCWEPGFQVLEPGNHCGPPNMWAVMEAECAEVCYAHNKKAAQAIADALNREWDDEEKHP
jgi:hypothetical protein